MTHVLVKSVCKALTIQKQKDIFSTIPHVCPHKNLYTSVQSRFICNSQNLEMNQMPFKGQAVKQTVWYNLAIKRRILLTYAMSWWISKELFWVNRANIERWHTVRFHLYNMLDVTKLQRTGSVTRLQLVLPLVSHRQRPHQVELPHEIIFMCTSKKTTGNNFQSCDPLSKSREASSFY